jgi:hypothetical protein
MPCSNQSKERENESENKYYTSKTSYNLNLTELSSF